MSIYKEKKVLITGASAGIGYALSEELAKRGAEVIITARRKDRLEELAKKIESAGGKAHIFTEDLSLPESGMKLYDQIKSAGLKVDILINNAGITRDNLSIRMKDEEWDKVININLSAPMRLTRQVIKGMLKRRSGRVIFISSIVGYTGNAGQSNYAASKSALAGFTKSIALEVASRGITCNLIAPGFISTPMTDKLSDDQKKNIVINIPANRLGNVDDISNGCVYLASDEAGFVTGTTLHINGGMNMI